MIKKDTTPKSPYGDLIERIMNANSITTMMGWAAVGQDYANPRKKDAPSGFDYERAATVVSSLLTDVCGELDAMEGQSKPKMEVVA